VNHDPGTIAALRGVTTATITTQLLKKGVPTVWMRSIRPMMTGFPRVVGPAFTLRFIPRREDVATPESWSAPVSTRAAIEQMPPGCVVVVDGRGCTDAGIFGDILCARLKQRGVAGLVTDGGIRDIAGVRATGLPIWAGGIAAPPSVAGLTFVGWQDPIGCGGVAVYPDDIIVADDDGPVVIPAALAADIARDGPAQEKLEAWIMREVEKGATLPGLYPPSAETRARYERESGG